MIELRQLLSVNKVSQIKAQIACIKTNVIDIFYCMYFYCCCLHLQAALPWDTNIVLAN